MALKPAVSVRRGAQAEISVINPVRWSPVFWTCSLVSSRILSITFAWSAGLIALNWSSVIPSWLIISANRDQHPAG
jgi:hypothetical protein